jgi:hypothetical protein
MSASTNVLFDTFFRPVASHRRSSVFMEVVGSIVGTFVHRRGQRGGHSDLRVHRRRQRGVRRDSTSNGLCGDCAHFFASVRGSNLKSHCVKTLPRTPHESTRKCRVSMHRCERPFPILVRPRHCQDVTCTVVVVVRECYSPQKLTWSLVGPRLLPHCLAVIPHARAPRVARTVVVPMRMSGTRTVPTRSHACNAPCRQHMVASPSHVPRNCITDFSQAVCVAGAPTVDGKIVSFRCCRVRGDCGASDPS